MMRLLCMLGLHDWAYDGAWRRECCRCNRVQRKGAQGTTDPIGWHTSLEQVQLINRSRVVRGNLERM